jgi:hypothetical protein
MYFNKKVLFMTLPPAPARQRLMPRLAALHEHAAAADRNM